MSKSILTTFVVAALAVATGLVLDGTGFFAGASGAFAAWLASSGIAGEGAVSVPAIGVLATVLGSLFTAWVGTLAERLREVIWVPLATAFLIFTGSVVMAVLGALVSPFAAVASCIIVGVIGCVAGLTKTGGRGRVARRLLAGRASAATMGSGGGIESPCKREITVVTVRLLGVGDLVGGLDPRSVTEVGSAIDAAVRTTFLGAGAVIDRSAPDCIFATFGAFGEDEGSGASSGIRAAVEVRDRVRSAAMALTEKLREEVRVGISVETGAAVVGVFKVAGAREDFGVLGPVIDTGRRLAGANAIYGSRILLGNRAYQLAGDLVSVRPMEMLSDPLSGSMGEVYEVLALAGELGEEAEERREVFWKAVILFREGEWKDALAHFERARSGEVTDSPLEYFIGLARRAYAGEPPDQKRPDGGKGGVQKRSHARDARTL